MRCKNLMVSLLLIISLLLPVSQAVAAVWTDHYDVSNGYSLAGEGVSTITFDDWGYTGPLGRNAKDFAPVNGFGPLGQQQHVVTLWPDRLTPDSPSSILKDITNTPVYTNANMDAQVNFYHWGYTTPGFDRQSDYTAYKAKNYSASTRPGCIFDNMLIDQDGDYFVSKSDMHFGYYDTFSYVDATGVNPPQDVVTTLSFQPYPVSDATGWCGSALLNNPTALEIMAGQLTFDFAFDVYNGPNRSFMGTQIAPGFQMRSYGTLTVNVQVGADTQTFSSNAVINNTYPGNTDRWDLDPAFINNVSFHGGGVLPDGVWVSADSFNPDGSRKLNPNGTWNVTVVPAGTPGAQWHINAFAGFAFILRADGIRLLDWYDPSHFGPDPCAGKNCDDGNICTTDTCVGGVCVNVNNTAPCSDNNACTTGDVCSNGACQPGTPVNCDDGNSCTTDACDMATGNCTHALIPGCGSCSGKPNGAPCDDGDPCTLNDFCTNEICGGPPKNCNDGNACTDDSCDPVSGNCVHVNNTASCSDGNACTTGDMCSNGVCAGTPVNCDDGNPGTDDSCNTATGACVHTPNSNACDDGNACTINDVYSNGLCSGTPINCDDGNLCTTDSCNTATGVCVHTPVPNCVAEQLQGRLLIEAGTYFCMGAAYPSGSCVPFTGGSDGGLILGQYQPMHILPDKCGNDTGSGLGTGYSLPETGGPAAIAAVYNFFGVPTYPSTNAVSWQTCNLHTAPTVTAGAVDPVTGCRDLSGDISAWDVFWNGSVFEQGPREGTPTNPVKVYAKGQLCPDNSYTLSWPALIVNGPFNGVTGYYLLVGHHNPCTTTTCEDNNVCTDDSFDPAACQCIHTPNTKPCDDHNAGTTGDTCSNGVCVGIPTNCDDGNVCTTDTVDPVTGACVHTFNTAACDDGDGCTVNDTCSGGVCVAGTPKNCDDGNTCTADSCVAGVCVHTIICGPVGDPLPAGTLLGIDPGFGSGPNIPCATGSCFGMEVSPGFVLWTDYGPGTDGGFVLGKNQLPGGQEIDGTNPNPGELSDAWYFFSNYGSFFTSPDGGALNKFDKAPCAGSGCIGKTELKVLNVAWNSGLIPMGSAAGCALPACTPDQLAGIFVTDYQIDPVTGGAWSINYNQVVPNGSFSGVKFSTTIRGTVVVADPCADAGIRCNDNNACTADTCDPGTGVCAHAAVANGTTCSSANKCLLSTTCTNGVCGGTVKVCNDNNPCTTDTCTTSTGACKYTASSGAACNDNNVCTVNDVCMSGLCKGTTKNCSDNNVCTTDSCDSATGACISIPVSPTCGLPGDPLPNGTRLGIAQGVGSGSNIPCSTGSCFGMEVSPGLVAYTDFGPGTDGGFVVGKDQLCGELSNSWFFFNAYGCFYTSPDGGTQNKFNKTSCSGADCINKTELKVLNVIWNGSFIPMGSAAGCTHANCSTSQKEGIFVNDYQIDPNSGAWSMNFAQVVPSGQFTGVRFSAIFRGMETANLCSDAATRCDDNDVCTTDSCDPATGNCNHAAVPTDDGDACTADSCDPATGVKHVTITCDDNNACTTDGCNPASGCYHVPVVCDDNNACTTDKCDPAIGCFAVPVQTDDGDPCTTDSCDPAAGGITHIRLSCDDNNICTTDACVNGVCVYTPIVCIPIDACDTCSCDPLSGVVHTPIVCNDNNSCTIDGCINGVCVYTPSADGTSCTVGSSSGTCSAGICTVCPAGSVKSVTIRGGGQKPTGCDLQIQTSFTVVNGGCIVASTNSTITVTPGTVLQFDCQQGGGPQPTGGTWKSAPIQTDTNHLIECPAATGDVGVLKFWNTDNPLGCDTDRMTIKVQ